MKFIFKVKIKKGHTEQEYVGAWKRGSTRIQKSEGAKGTVLYRNISEPGKLLAIATWQSKVARDAAMQQLDAAGSQTQEILHAHKTYGDTEIIGNFEEIARVEP